MASDQPYLTGLSYPILPATRISYGLRVYIFIIQIYFQFPYLKKTKTIFGKQRCQCLDQKTISYDLSVFGLFYDDRIGIILDDRANRVRKNIGTAFIYGLEMFGEINLIEIIKSESSKVRAGIFINTAITKSSYLRSEENNVEGKQVEFIPKLNFKTGINFGYKNFSGSLQWIYLSEQYTDVENSSIAMEGDMRNGLIGQIPKYDVMDLSLSYLMGRFKLETGINNLLDEKYFTRRAISYPGPGIIPSDSRSFYSTLQVKF